MLHMQYCAMLSLPDIHTHTHAVAVFVLALPASSHVVLCTYEINHRLTQFETGLISDAHIDYNSNILYHRLEHTVTTAEISCWDKVRIKT